VFIFPCSITRGPTLFHEKHPHALMSRPPNFTAGRCNSPGVRHTQTLPSGGHMVLHDSSLQITRFQLSTVQWHSSLNHFRRRLAFIGEMFGLLPDARLWYPIPLNSGCTVMVLAGQFIALQNLRVIVSLMSSKFHESLSSMLGSPCQSLNVAYPVVLLWLCLHVSTSQ
jgi:hypothetical protein